MIRSCLIIILFSTLVSSENCSAQGRIQKKRDTLRRNAGKEPNEKSDDQRKDFEGSIWEFKVIDRSEDDKSKQTKLSGRFRIKQTAVFSVGDVESHELSEKKTTKSDKDEISKSKLKGQLKNFLSERVKEDTGTGGERIGDFSKKSSKQYVIKFDQDDDYPLSGRVELKPDTKNKGGVWFGKYVQYLEGNKKKSWRMEMRKIDE